MVGSGCHQSHIATCPPCQARRTLVADQERQKGASPPLCCIHRHLTSKSPRLALLGPCNPYLVHETRHGPESQPDRFMQYWQISNRFHSLFLETDTTCRALASHAGTCMILDVSITTPHLPPVRFHHASRKAWQHGDSVGNRSNVSFPSQCNPPSARIIRAHLSPEKTQNLDRVFAGSLKSYPASLSPSRHLAIST